jgi:hypothetical protein
MWQLRQLASKEDLLDSEMKPGREARRTPTHERSSGAEMHDRIGHAHVPMNSYWDIRDLSVYLHVKPSTLYAWAGQGRIPCLKILGLLRFRREEAYGAWKNAPRKGAVQTMSRRAMTWRTYLQTLGNPNWKATGTE